MRAVARAFAYLYVVLISLAALGLAWVALSSGAHLRLPMFYAEGAHLTYWLLAAGIVGLTTVVLAMIGVTRWPLSLLAAGGVRRAFSRVFPELLRLLGRVGILVRCLVHGGRAGGVRCAAWRRDA
jgi:hypothetical protein